MIRTAVAARLGARSPGPIAAAVLLLAAATARADVTVTATFGFDGVFVNGTVTPVRVELASTDKTPIRCRLELSAGRGVPGMTGDGIVYAANVFLSPGAKKRITVPVLSRGYGDGEWRLTVRTDRRTLLRRGTDYEDGRAMQFVVWPPATATPRNYLDPMSPVVGVLGDPTLRCDWLGDTDRYTRNVAPKDQIASKVNWGSTRLHPPGCPPAAVPEFVGVSPESAPDLWLCYEGMDALLWVDPDPEALQDASQLAAILEFAANGGRLLVALTPGSRLAAASPLAAALPALASGHDDVPAAEVAKALAGGSPGIVGLPAGVRPGALPGPPVPVARLGVVRGKVMARLPDGRPLFVTESYGLGTIGVLTFDPRLLSDATAPAHAAILRLLFGSVVHGEPPGQEAPPTASSLDPLVNHLRKRFLTPPPLLVLVAGLLVYVVAIGPVDYFLLKRKNRLRRTVITFPLIVAGFTLLAYGTSFLLFGVSSGQVRVAWIDLATAPGRDADVVRGLDVLGTYSPVGTTLRVGYDQPRSFLGSLWLAGGSYYQMEGAGGSLDGVLEQGPDGRPAGEFDLPLRSHRTVQARFSGEVPSSLDASVTKAGGRRVLQIRNGLPVRVREIAVVDGDRVAFPGDLEPNGKVVLEMEGAAWTKFGSDVRLPEPAGAAEGLFSNSFEYGAFGRGGGQFAPADDTEKESAAARSRMARALMGASVGGLWTPAANGTSGRIRMLARQGADLSPAVRDGRILVMGWCDGDPLGKLPAGRNLRSTTVVVRRLLPAEEEAR